MRIIHFVENYLQVTETFIYNYICKSAESAEVAVVTFDKMNEGQFPLPAGARIHVLKKDPAFARKDLTRLHWLLLRRFFGTRIWYGDLKCFIRDFQPDLVHCHFGVTGVYFTDFCRHEKMKVPFVTNFYGYDASELPQRDKVYAAGLTRLWEDSALLMAEGPAMGRRLEALGAPRAKIALSPIIVDGRKYPTRHLARKQGPVRFLLIGRFVEKKGFHLFLEALGRVKHELPDFQVIMIGSGPMQADYQSIITRYDITNRVSFEGFRKLSECMDYMLDADVLVQPSVTAANGDSEGGAPTILIEAQIIGIPIIASTHADIPFVMGYDDFLAKEGDVADLSRVIRLFVDSNAIADKITAGKAKAAGQHDMNKTTAYQEILSQFSN
jgi:colanic acid/amylovoran biosynthesis glycosyltransferase